MSERSIVATRHIPQPRRWGIFKRPDLEARETIFTTDQVGPSRKIFEGEYLTVDITGHNDDGSAKVGASRLYPHPPKPRRLTWRQRRQERRLDRETEAWAATEYD